MASDQRKRSFNSALSGALGLAKLDRRDRALSTELAYGAVRMQRACDWLIAAHLNGGVGRLDPEVRAGLRLGPTNCTGPGYRGMPRCQRRSQRFTDAGARS
jgi:hypothetical protein